MKKEKTTIETETIDNKDVVSLLLNINKETQLKNRLIILNDKKQSLLKKLNKFDKEISETYLAIKKIREENKEESQNDNGAE